MKLSRSLLVALLGALLLTSSHAQTEADISALLTKAQRGNSIAQYRLGLAYSNGQGIAADPIEAYVWLSLAYEGGFRGKALALVAGALEPAQFEAARQRLAERRASLNGKPAPAAPAKAVATEGDAGIPVVRTSSAPEAAPAPATTTKLAEELAAAVADKQQLSGELSQSWSEAETLKKQLTDTQAAADFLTAETSKLHAERDALTTKLTELSTETAALRNERDSARTLGVQAEAALTQANTQKTELEASLRSANDNAATDKKWLGDELTKSFQEVTTLKAQLAEAGKHAPAPAATPAYPDLSAKVKELEAALTALTTEAGSTKQEASRLADERLEREKHLVTLQQQATDSANALAALQQETQSLRQASALPVAPAYTDLREQVASLSSQLVTLKGEATQAAQQIATLTLAKTAAENTPVLPPPAPAYPDLSAKVQELETSLAAQTALAEKAQAALQSSQPAPATPAYPDLSAKVQELEASLVARVTDVASAGRMADEFRQAKTDAEQKLAATEQARTEVTQQFEEFKRSALANQREHLNLQSKLQMVEAEKAALRQQSTADQTRLADLSSQLAASRRQLAETYPTTPAYPDQRARVEQLETELKKTNEQASSMVTLLNQSQQEAKTATEQTAQLHATITELETAVAAKRSPKAAPAYPDLRTRVAQLEAELSRNNELATSTSELLTRTQQEAKAATEQAGQLRATLSELESKAAAQPAAVAAPAYPDLSAKVRELETALGAAKPAAPAYPDLREQVGNLEIQLEAARALPKFMVSESQFTAMKQDLADTKTKLATTLHGYSLIEKERDALAAKSTQAVNTSAEVARLTEANNALQNTTAQTARDLAATRAQLQQALSANNALAQSTPAAKSVPAPEPVAVRPLAKPTAPAAPIIAAVTPAPAPVPVVVAPVAAPRIHVIAAGDSLTKISQRYYGTPNNWQPIYNANKEKLGPNGALKVGTELRIP